MKWEHILRAGLTEVSQIWVFSDISMAFISIQNNAETVRVSVEIYEHIGCYISAFRSADYVKFTVYKSKTYAIEIKKIKFSKMLLNINKFSLQ